MRRFAFLTDGYVLAMLGLGAALNVGLWYFLHRSITPEMAFVPLHFTAASGVDLIGEPGELYNLPYVAVLISAANVVVGRLVYRYDMLSSYILLSALPLLNGLVFLNGYLLIAVNG